MLKLVLLGGALAEEAVLAEVEVEAPQAAISETDDREHLAHVALGLMLGELGGGQPMHHRQPDDTLRLLLHPLEERPHAYGRSQPHGFKA